jgi:hypothetical protein
MHTDTAKVLEAVKAPNVASAPLEFPLAMK